MASIPGLWTPYRRTETSGDYESVLVALEDAHLHSYSYRLGRRCEFDESSEDHSMDDEEAGHGNIKAGDENEGTAMLEMSCPEYSIEGLRREVRKGSKGEKWTAYESKHCIIPFHSCPVQCQKVF
jgi:hypothetical protein